MEYCSTREKSSLFRLILVKFPGKALIELTVSEPITVSNITRQRMDVQVKWDNVHISLAQSNTTHNKTHIHQSFYALGTTLSAVYTFLFNSHHNSKR